MSVCLLEEVIVFDWNGNYNAYVSSDLFFHNNAMQSINR